MSEITLALEHPSLGYGEIIARYDLSNIQEKAYQQGRADERTKIEVMLSELPTVNGYIDSAYLWLKWEQLKGAENEQNSRN